MPLRSPWPLLLALALAPGCSRTGLDLDELSESEDAGAAVACTPGTFALTKAVPAVMFVLDRSGSMDDLFGTTSRWQVLTNALSATLPPVDTSMEIGALLFPNSDDDSDLQQSCALPGAPDLAPATGNASPLLDLLYQTQPAGGTPTAGALGVAAAALTGLRAASTARVMVLATDGAPNCNASLDPRTCTCADPQLPCEQQALECLDDARTLDGIRSYTAEGIPTYVIGIQDPGDTENTQVLNAMAVAGGRPQTGAATSYYAATSEADLDDALVAIRDQVGGCTFLTSSVPGADGSIVVTFDGAALPYDPTGASGWSWGDKANGQILLAASVCTTVTANADPSLTAQVACVTPDASAP